MKNSLLCIALSMFIFTGLMAQEESEGLKGASWGLVAFNYSNSEANDLTSFLILPAYGKFITPDVTIGAAVGLSSTKFGSNDANNLIVIKPLLRKYWGVTSTFYIFGEANVPILLGENFKGYGANFDLGIDYFIGGKWTIEAKFGRFGYNVISPDNGDSVGNLFLGLNMFDSQTQEGLSNGLSLGLKYLL